MDEDSKPICELDRETDDMNYSQGWISARSRKAKGAIVINEERKRNSFSSTVMNTSLNSQITENRFQCDSKNSLQTHRQNT